MNVWFLDDSNLIVLRRVDRAAVDECLAVPFSGAGIADIRAGLSNGWEGLVVELSYWNVASSCIPRVAGENLC